MRGHAAVIEILEGQAVYISAARRAVPISVCKLLLKEEILAANVKALALLRQEEKRSCRGCATYRGQIEELRARLASAMLRIGEIRLVLLETQKLWPDGPYGRWEGESLLRRIERSLDGNQEV